MMPLRTVMLMDADPNPDTGAAGKGIAIARELERQGHRVRTIWGDRLSHRIAHWNLHHLLEQPRAYRSAVRGALTSGAFDVLHVNQPAGWLAARENRRLRRRSLFVHRSHGFEPRIAAVLDRWRMVYPEDLRPPIRKAATRGLQRLLDRNYRGIVRWADSHVVSCTECAEDLVERGVDRSNIHVSPQVPVASSFERPAPPWTRERSRRLLFVGQHSFMKAPMVLAKAVSELLRTHADWRMTWVCEPAAHEAVRSRLAPEVRDRVQLLPWMARERLQLVYDEHGVFLFTSFTEGFGKVFLEAMARGLCVVATDQSGARDVIRTEVNGILVPVGDSPALVASVERLAASQDLSRSISAAARDTAERYTWAGVVEDIVDFYRARLKATGKADAGEARR